LIRCYCISRQVEAEKFQNSNPVPSNLNPVPAKLGLWGHWEMRDTDPFHLKKIQLIAGTTVPHPIATDARIRIGIAE
jgi:hypothetical protein